MCPLLATQRERENRGPSSFPRRARSRTSEIAGVTIKRWSPASISAAAQTYTRNSREHDHVWRCQNWQHFHSQNIKDSNSSVVMATDHARSSARPLHFVCHPSHTSRHALPYTPYRQRAQAQQPQNTRSCFKCFKDYSIESLPKP
jgi:hypothetical protein